MIGLHDETILCVGPKMARVQLRAAIPMFWSQFLGND
jgi:hypothetical protein